MQEVVKEYVKKWDIDVVSTLSHVPIQESNTIDPNIRLLWYKRPHKSPRRILGHSSLRKHRLFSTTDIHAELNSINTQVHHPWRFAVYSIAIHDAHHQGYALINEKF